MKDEKMYIKITNEGTRIGLIMFLNALIGLASFHNSHPKKKKIEDYRDDLVENLEKAIKWTERKDDKTCDKKELTKIRAEAKKMIKWIKKIWK